MKFVDITNDIAFRKIFGSETKKISLISFLNAVIKLPNSSQISDVELLNPYQLPKLSGGKTTILDIKARDNNKNTFIVEMQIVENDHFHKRVLYYTSQSYTNQITKGTQYEKLYPVYFIGILQFNITKNPHYFSCHRVLDVETNEQVFQDVEFNLIELPKFHKQLNELNSSIDQWVYFIKNAENLEVIPQNVSDEGLRQAYQQAEKYTWQPQEMEDYERANIKEADDRLHFEFKLRQATEIMAQKTQAAEAEAKNAQTEAKNAQAEAKNAQAEAKNAQAEAKDAQMKTQKIVATLLKSGLSTEIIAASTGLTIEEVTKMIDDNNFSIQDE